MTTKVVFINSDQHSEVSGTPEQAGVKILKSIEGDLTMVVDVGDSSLVIDSVETGGGARKTRSFILNAQHPEFDPKTEGVYLPFVEKILFQGSGRKEQK